MNVFKRVYGASPLHVIAVAVSFTLSGYAILKLLDAPQSLSIFIWLLGAAIGHDLIAFPIYSALDRIAAQEPGRRVPVSAINYIRAPAFLSGVLFLVYFPLILMRSEPRFTNSTSVSSDVYLGRWLLITGVTFLLSGLVYAIRLRRSSAHTDTRRA